MSEIRDRIIKILSESKIPFMEDNVEMQPDLFDADRDTFYKDGRKALRFREVLDAMEEIAPEFEFAEDTDNNGLYWMIFYPKPGVAVSPEKVKEIESELNKKFGEETVSVRGAQTQYAPEIKKLYVGFVDDADFMEEAAPKFKKGQRVRIAPSAENFQGEEGVIVSCNNTAVSGTPFCTVQLDNGEPYDVLASNLEFVSSGLGEGKLGNNMPWVYQDLGVAANSPIKSNKDQNYGKYVIVRNGGNGALDYLSRYFDTEQEAKDALNRFSYVWDKKANAAALKKGK